MSSCFGPIFGGCHQGPIASTGPVFNPILGLRLRPAHLLFQTPSVDMLQIWNHRHFRHFWIIKNIGLEPIIFSINLDIESSFKIFSTFDSMYISIVLLI